MEGNPALGSVWLTDLFADTSCDTPLKEGHISNLRTDGPGLSPNEPMALVQVTSPSIPDGKYAIKNRAADFFWNAAGCNPLQTVYFYLATMEHVKTASHKAYFQVNKLSPII